MIEPAGARIIGSKKEESSIFIPHKTPQAGTTSPAWERRPVNDGTVNGMRTLSPAPARGSGSSEQVVIAEVRAGAGTRGYGDKCGPTGQVPVLTTQSAGSRTVV